IDEAMIERLVHRFYDRVRVDPLLAPVFNARIADWAPHLEKMCAFWSSVALMTGRYHGQPVVAHRELPVGAEHFDRWLALFRATAESECPPVAADHFIERAERIAESLELAAAVHKGAPLPPPRTRAGAARRGTVRPNQGESR
ncbi:MAG: group III truncated hemoglobin, partial [Bauldia litoralis]